jgi:hypothetical protein
MVPGPVPAGFAVFRNLMVDHLEKILRDTLTTSVPMHAAALVVMVGYETLANCTDPPAGTRQDSHWRFARQHRDLYGIDVSLGDRMFNALRNGLAHAYGQYPIPVEGLGEVRLILTWKDGAHLHLRPVTVTLVEGQAQLAPATEPPGVGPVFVCVDVASLCMDLLALIDEVEAALAADAAAGRRFEELLAENRQRFSRSLRGFIFAKPKPSLKYWSLADGERLPG